MFKDNTEQLETEKRNESSYDLDQLSTREILMKINDEDQKVAGQVRNVIDSVNDAVEIIVDAMKNGGRLVYMGAGTSGRVGAVDSSECPPTFGVDPSRVIALMAGGESAFLNASENIEDSIEAAIKDIKNIEFTKDDVLVGVAASGRTPYVIEGIKFAKSLGAKTVAVSNNKDTLIGTIADVDIAVETGREVLTGSTRMKAACAQKMVLNMISLTTMIKLGKVYENLMVDVKANNIKLQNRCIRIVKDATDAPIEKIASILEENQYNVKLTILMIKTGLNAMEALALLNKSDGYLRVALEERM